MSRPVWAALSGLVVSRALMAREPGQQPPREHKGERKQFGELSFEVLADRPAAQAPQRRAVVPLALPPILVKPEGKRADVMWQGPCSGQFTTVEVSVFSIIAENQLNVSVEGWLTPNWTERS